MNFAALDDNSLALSREACCVMVDSIDVSILPFEVIVSTGGLDLPATMHGLERAHSVLHPSAPLRGNTGRPLTHS